MFTDSGREIFRKRTERYSPAAAAGGDGEQQGAAGNDEKRWEAEGGDGRIFIKTRKLIFIKSRRYEP